MPMHKTIVGPPHAFTDGEGVPWTVREYRADGNGATGGTPCLVFECDGAFRLVRGFPSDWRGLAPLELSKLSWQR
jgi:hypothetical protein